MADTRSTVWIQRDKTLLAHLESQLKIETARYKAFNNVTDAAVYWMAYSTGEVIFEIERQIKELKEIKYSDTPPHLRNKK